MTIFVTGGTGFIGNAIVKKLIDSGHDVACLTRQRSNYAKLKELGAEIVFGDIRLKSSMAQAVSQCDKVFHIAAWYEFGIWNKRKMFEINVVGTQNVLGLALEHKKKVVYCSSAGTLGPSGDSSKSETSDRPEIFTSEYERTKYIAHMEAQKYARKGLELVTVMPGAVFGPEDTSLVGIVLGQYIRGKLRFFVKVGAKFSWVHIDDIANGFLLADEKGVAGQSYILTDKHLGILELLKKSEEITNVPAPKRLVGRGLVKFAAPFAEVFSKMRRRKAILSREAAIMLQHNWTYDSSKARNELGWMPENFDIRLRATMVWYVSHYAKRK